MTKNRIFTLPDEIQTHIWNMYYNNYVIKELKEKLQPGGILKLNMNIGTEDNRTLDFNKFDRRIYIEYLNIYNYVSGSKKIPLDFPDQIINEYLSRKENPEKRSLFNPLYNNLHDFRIPDEQIKKYLSRITE